MPPNKLEIGARELSQLYTFEDLGLVVIPSVSFGLNVHPLYIRKLKEHLGFDFLPGNIHEYVPSDDVGYAKSGFTRRLFGITAPRQEVIPRVNPELAYIILDDTLESGKTLDKAIERMTEQGVRRDELYFFCQAIENFADGPFLDHVDRFPRWKSD